jgi:hypothetical protein
MEPIDIVLLSHNRLDYLRRAVDALFARTPEPFRLTIVDNASRPDVRNWLAANRNRIHRVIALPENEHVPAFQHGIDATTSDPYVVSDPDIEVPELEPSWLARLHALLDRHPEYGLVGVALRGQEFPDAEIVDANVGTVFQMIRRDALREPYVKDSRTCTAVREAGYLVGVAPRVVATNLGGGDPERYPGHIAAKNELVSRRVERGEFSPYVFYYRELERIARPPTLTEVARAAPAVAEIRAAGVPPASVLEVARTAPAVAAVLPDARALAAPPARLPFADGAAGAVVLVEPPDTALLEEAFRVAAKLVVLDAGLAVVGGRLADELAPAGWEATERPGQSAIPLELARSGDELPELAGRERFTTLEHRDEWLSFFASGAFGDGETRLFVFRRAEPLAVPERVEATEEVEWWQPEPRVPPAPRRSLRQRVRALAGRFRP